jgi:hypothetical protein
MNNYRMEDRDDAQSIRYNYSDETETSPVDKYVSISDLMVKGKKALKSGGGLLSYQKNLTKEIHILTGKVPSPKEKTAFNPDDEMQMVVLDTWTDEVLRFLSLKTITGDNTEPCQIFPGHAVGVAWKVLMLTPSLYSKVCLAMGNQNVFDHDPSDTATSKVQEKHKIKRYNATLRAYESYFDRQPPPLYWNFHKKKVVEESGFAAMIKQCGVDVDFITDPFAAEPKAEPKMSPHMPIL